MGSLGAAPEGEDFFSEENVTKALEDAFVKFDKDKSGWLGFTEFARAWESLGLGSREDEIMKAYYKVDTDRSGSIELQEFMDAIQGSKLDELYMNLIVAKMGKELGIQMGDYSKSKAAYKSFEMTAQRRRLLKQKMEEDMKNNLTVLVDKLCTHLNEPVPDPEGRKLYQTMNDTFNAFDNHGVDGSGHVDQNEFAFALMGQEALKYGPLADMELLNKMLDRVSGNAMAQLAASDNMKKSAAQQASENEALRNRLEQLKSKQDSEMAKMIGKINALAGMDAIKFMSDAEMDKILYDVFKKFDVDGSGTMELPEFKVAWRKELNLGGTDAEIAKAFRDVDVDNSGVIEISEFKEAIKGERMAELNMKVIASNMETSIDSLSDYMKNFKQRYENAMATAKRRRAMRAKFVNRLMQRAGELLEKLEQVDSDTKTTKDEKGAKFYRQLMETFDAFDKDGNGELQFPEYTSAWRFLNQPGADRDIKQAFDGVDVDRSGLVDR